LVLAPLPFERARSFSCAFRSFFFSLFTERSEASFFDGLRVPFGVVL
jgi:hypothetical protein